MDINREEIYSRLSRHFPEEDARELAYVLVEVAEEIKKAGVSSGDLNELKGVVKDLAEAQRRTEQRLEELAVAQRRTEQRLEELAVAQRSTEQRLEELAVAQRRTEQRLEELAVAQRRTEEEIGTLTKNVKRIHKDFGGLSHTVGFTLEDSSYKALPQLLEADFGIKIKDRFLRRFIEYPGGEIEEVNIFGRGLREGKEITILGEAKAQLSNKDIDRFLKKVERLSRVVKGEKFLLAVTFMVARPSVLKYAEEKNIKIYHSYEF